MEACGVVGSLGRSAAARDEVLGGDHDVTVLDEMMQVSLRGIVDETGGLLDPFRKGSMQDHDRRKLAVRCCSLGLIGDRQIRMRSLVGFHGIADELSRVAFRDFDRLVDLDIERWFGGLVLIADQIEEPVVKHLAVALPVGGGLDPSGEVIPRGDDLRRVGAGPHGIVCKNRSGRDSEQQPACNSETDQSSIE